MIKSLNLVITHHSQSSVLSRCFCRQSIKMPNSSRKRTKETPQTVPAKKINRDTITNTNRLTRDFFEAPSTVLAEKLLGKLLIRRQESGTLLKGRIVETECYPGGDDKGSSTHDGRRTPANEPLYMEPGTVFVYMTYGMYHCMNISSSEPGGGVFIRALEAIEGIDEMKQLRLAKIRSTKNLKVQELCAGPSKLCISLQIEKSTCNKLDLVSDDSLWIENDPSFDDVFKIIKTTRIGINSAGKEAINKPYRYYILGNDNVSKIDKAKEELAY